MFLSFLWIFLCVLFFPASEKMDKEKGWTDDLHFLGTTNTFPRIDFRITFTFLQIFRKINAILWDIIQLVFWLFVQKQTGHPILVSCMKN